MTEDEKKMNDLDAAAKDAQAAASKAAEAATSAKEASEVADRKKKEADVKASANPDDAELKAAAEVAGKDAADKADAANVASDASDMANAQANAASDAAKKARSDAAAGAGEAGTPPQHPPRPDTAAYFDLLKAVVIDKTMDGKQKQMLLKVLRSTNPASDKLTYRSAIFILGLVVNLTIIAIWTLLWNNPAIEVPSGLIAIGSGAAGGLAGLLTPGRNADSHT